MCSPKLPRPRAPLPVAFVALALSFAASLAAQVVPAPRSLSVEPGSVSAARAVCEVDDFAPAVTAFAAAVEDFGCDGFTVASQATNDTRVVFVRADDARRVGEEWHRISADPNGLVVEAASARGVARAAATLLQLVEVVDGVATWPRLELEDAPDLPFRCFMVDIGRNPHRPQTLRRIVDACWFYKVGYLQLHLTDDQLFSWPSRAFPKLLDERSGWTWEDFVALEAYSQARGVTIVPEIDVPAHSSILRGRYPEVFGETPSDLATLPQATEGMQRLLAELLEVFRATPYVHIGGDEAYGVPLPAQRAFLNRLNRFVREHGRRSIVWEGPELGEGDDKVDTDVIHVNWRTIEAPAQRMLEAGYEVVHASWDPMYVVDHYPRTMFTAVPVRRCYEWDRRRFAHVDPGMPTFLEPHVTDTNDGILGFLMAWWEGREENVLPLCVPRLAAVASAAWNRDGERDFASFEQRQRRLLPRYERLAGADLGRTPFADASSQVDNLAWRGAVTVSTGASQPVFGPERLTNGIPDRFDHFLGYPTQPVPLEITIELPRPADVGRVVVHERAIGESHELYELLTSPDGVAWQKVGETEKGSRGDRTFVEHRFEPRPVRFLRIRTRGCHGLTFPSFSRLSEVEAFAR